MSDSAEKIRGEDYVCITLDRYITKRKRQSNGEDDAFIEFDIMKTEAEVQNRIGLVQIKQDMGAMAEHTEECKSHPSVSRQLATKFTATVSKIFLFGFIMFTVYYTIVTVAGLSELIKAAIP